MKRIPSLLAPLPALALLAATAAAQVRNQDLEVYRPLASSATQVAKAFDADWTASGLLAMAFVEDLGRGDRLVIGLHDPDPNAPVPFAQVAEYFFASGWHFDEVSLAVPPREHQDPELDRIFVAVSARADVQGQNMEVFAVRLFSCEIGMGPSKLRVTNPANVPSKAVPKGSEPPRAEVSVLPLGNDYVIDMAFVDPNGGLPLGGQILFSRSRDHGVTMEDACYVTGPCAPNAKNAPPQLLGTLYTNPALAAEELEGLTLLAVQDVDGEVVHLMFGDPAKKTFDYHDSTPARGRIVATPRLTSREGRYGMTCIGLDSSKYHDLIYYTGNRGAGLSEMGTLNTKTASEADIDVRSSTVYIVAMAAPDGSGALEALAFEGDLDGAPLPTEIPIVDDGVSDGLPRAAITPADARPKRLSYLFRRPADARAPAGVKRDG